MKNENAKYAVFLLNRIINESVDLTPEQIMDEKFLIEGELYCEIFNFLQNNSLDNFSNDKKLDKLTLLDLQERYKNI